MPVSEIVKGVFDICISVHETAGLHTILDLCEKLEGKRVPYYSMNHNDTTCTITSCWSASIFTALRGILKAKGHDISKFEPSTKLCELPTPTINEILKDLFRSFPNECPRVTSNRLFSRTWSVLTGFVTICSVSCGALFFVTEKWPFIAICFVALFLIGPCSSGVWQRPRFQAPGVETIKDLCKQIGYQMTVERDIRIPPRDMH